MKSSANPTRRYAAPIATDTKARLFLPDENTEKTIIAATTKIIPPIVGVPLL